MFVFTVSALVHDVPPLTPPPFPSPESMVEYSFTSMDRSLDERHRRTAVNDEIIVLSSGGSEAGKTNLKSVHFTHSAFIGGETHLFAHRLIFPEHPPVARTAPAASNNPTRCRRSLFRHDETTDDSIDRFSHIISSDSDEGTDKTLPVRARAWRDKMKLICVIFLFQI